MGQIHKVPPRRQVDEGGQRIVYDWFSADDGLYISQALNAMNSDEQSSKLVLPYQSSL